MPIIPKFFKGGLFEIFYGAATGALEKTGSIVIGSRYEIITTEPDYFGIGLVAGDRFTATTALSLKLANSVREVAPAIGTILYKNLTLHDTSTDVTLLEGQNGTAVVWFDSATSKIKITDGTNTAESPQFPSGNLITDTGSTTGSNWTQNPDGTWTSDGTQLTSNYVGWQLSRNLDGVLATFTGRVIDISAGSVYYYLEGGGDPVVVTEAGSFEDTQTGPYPAGTDVAQLFVSDDFVGTINLDTCTIPVDITEGSNIEELRVVLNETEMWITLNSIQGTKEMFTGYLPELGNRALAVSDDEYLTVSDVLVDDELAFDYVYHNGELVTHNGEPVIVYK